MDRGKIVAIITGLRQRSQESVVRRNRHLQKRGSRDVAWNVPTETGVGRKN